MRASSLAWWLLLCKDDVVIEDPNGVRHKVVRVLKDADEDVVRILMGEEITPHPERCGKTGCEGFSCPYCGKCTVTCPNMRCVRETNEEVG